MNVMRLPTVLMATMSTLVLASALIVLAQDGNLAKARVETLAKTSAAGGIERIEVFRLPKFYTNIKQIQPDDLEALWHYKMTIRELVPRKQELIARALATANIQRSDRTWDLRWGVVFYWPKDKRIAALYFDETGRYGSVDQIPVSFAPGFFTQLKSALRLSLE